MKTPRSHSTVSRSGRQAKEGSAQPRTSGVLPPKILKRWRMHYQTLSGLRDRLIEERSASLRDAAEPGERHSMHPADSATDEFDHELALSQLSAEQDALYEVEGAMKRILDGTYGICEETGKRIPTTRLKAIPWTRFCHDVEARLESTGEIRRPHLGMLRSVRQQPAALTEIETTVEQPEPVEPAEPPTEEPSDG